MPVLSLRNCSLKPYICRSLYLIIFCPSLIYRFQTRRMIIWMLAINCCYLLLVSCTNLSKSDKDQVQEVKTSGKISSIIRSPVTLDGQTDTSSVAVMKFIEYEHDFGDVKQGTVVKYSFEFVNTGKVPLVIHDARSTCGCTVPDWPKTPINPGDRGAINVVFDTQGRSGLQEKPITISANTYPSTNKINLKGRIS